LPAAGGCLLFRSSPAISLLNGTASSIILPDGSQLWSFSGATLTAGGSVSNGVGAVVTNDDATKCFPSAMVEPTPLFAPSPRNATDLLVPLDLVRVGDAVWSYYQAFALDAAQPFGVRSVGFGIAKRDMTTGQFQPTASMLWAGDGPAYGTSALVMGNDLYAYGCASSSCYVAKAPLASMDDPAAYLYATGAGRFSADPTEARPILNGPASISVRQHLSGRLLATYLAPLGTELLVRSALGPTGPFSREYRLASCEAGTHDFCVGGVRHPQLETEGTLAISYSAASFDSTPPGDRYWAKLAFVKLPLELP
jgi:hypothetical protein